MRRLGFVLAVLVAVVAGVASASAVVGGGGETTVNGPDSVQPDGRGARLPITAADPDGRASWGVRIYQSKTGLTCPEAGRTMDGNFGRVNSDESFTPLDVEAAGSCIDLTKATMSLTVEHHPAKGKLPARAVIFGATTSAIANIDLRLAGERRDVPISGNAYITVVREEALKGAQLTATLRDGSTKSYALQTDGPPAVEPAVPESAG
jgi:hypothetical protein